MLGWRHPKDERLVAFLTGNLDGLAQGSVEQHLSTCARCRRECAEIDKTLRLWDAARLELPGELITAAGTVRMNHLAAVVGRRAVLQSDENELEGVLESFLGRRSVAAFRDELNPESPR